MPSKWKSGRKMTPEEKKQHFLALSGAKRPKDKLEPSELPGWIRTAFVYIELEGKTYTEAAELFNRSASTLGQYALSPATKKWRAALRSVANDPAVLAKGILEAAVADCAANLLWAIEAAKRAGDFKEVRVGSAALLDRLNIQKKTAPEVKPTIVVTVIASKEPEVIVADTEVIDVEVEVEDDD